MIFQIHKVLTSPDGSDRKSYSVSIQIKESGEWSGEKNLIGSVCASEQEFKEQVERCIRDLRKLKFPK